MPKITKIIDNYVTLTGKYSYTQDDAFRLSDKALGIIMTAEQNKADLLVVGDPSSIIINEDVKFKVDYKKVRVYKHQFGKIINIAGKILFPEGVVVDENEQPAWSGEISNFSPSIFDRKKVKSPLETGIMAIDTMIPIGKGQRELIIGDRGTGKSSIAISTIINQRNTGVKSIYVSIGQKRSNIANLYETLKKHDALDNTIIMYANADSAAEQYIIPKIAMAMAEAMAYAGEDVLVVLDDLTKHANICREIALSVGRTPGREAYPTDIFYQHSYLLEKAGHFGDKYNNGSITALPIVETVGEDVASLIPSNIISITDGQIFTSNSMFQLGVIPAINIPMSVSRTGTIVQSNIVKHFSKHFKSDYSRLHEIQKYLELATEESSDDLVKQVEKFNGMKNMLIQHGFSGYTREMMYILSRLYELGALGRINDPKEFGEIFSSFCRKDIAAKKVITMIETLQPRDKIENAIQTVFIPFAKVLSGIQGDTYSLGEIESYRRSK